MNTLALNVFLNIPVLRGLMVTQRHCTLSGEGAQRGDDPIFIMAHGTWATRARCTHRHSKLSKSLSQRWPSAGFYRFQWSGVNGVRHRLQASEILAGHINERSRRLPNASIVALSHSHGGNVVAWAATMIEKPSAAAVYLNTPFIQVLEMKKGVMPVLPILLILLSGIVGLPFVMLIVKYAPPSS